MPIFEADQDGFEFRWERMEQNYRFKTWIEEVFAECDDNGDGVLDKDELRRMLERKERSEYEESVKIKKYFSAACPLPEKNAKNKQLAIENGDEFPGIDNEVFEWVNAAL